MPSGLTVTRWTSSPTGSSVSRVRRPSRTISAGRRAVSAFASPAGSGPPAGALAGSAFGSSLNRSRNPCSRNFGVRGTRSTRATCPGSVRWELSKNRDEPSGLQATPSAFVFARKPTGKACGLADATSTTFGSRKRRSSDDRKAIQRPSGDQANGRGVSSGGVASMRAVATTRSFPPFRSTTRSSRPSLRNARLRSSGANCGRTSVPGPSVSWRACPETKSYTNTCEPSGPAEV